MNLVKQPFFAWLGDCTHITQLQKVVKLVSHQILLLKSYNCKTISSNESPFTASNISRCGFSIFKQSPSLQHNVFEQDSLSQLSWFEEKTFCQGSLFLGHAVQRHVPYYSLIAFDEKVTFWLQRACHCLVRACLLHCMRVRLHNGYTQAYVQIMQHTHMHKAVSGRVEAKKLLSCWRQSNYSRFVFTIFSSKSLQFDGTKEMLNQGLAIPAMRANFGLRLPFQWHEDCLWKHETFFFFFFKQWGKSRS